MKNETTAELTLERITADLEFIGVTYNEQNELVIDVSKKHKWARAALALDNLRSERLTSQIAALRSAVLELILKVRNDPPTVVDNDPLRLAGWTAASTAIIDAILEDKALAATPADPVREAATALVADCESLIDRVYYARQNVDTVDLQAKVTALKTALEAK